MCDQPELPHRGNSYYISFRLDGDMIQLYRVSGDLFDLVATFPYDIEANALYDSKTIYNKSTGLIEIYVNDAFIGSWQDPSPIRKGNGISFRSSNARFAVDMVAVYPACHEKEIVQVGQKGHLMTCNPEPNLAAGRIMSINISPGGKSKVSTTFVDVDFTVPDVGTPREDWSDIDTLVNRTQLTLVNLVASDPHSALANFNVRIESLHGTIVMPDKEVTQSTLFETLSGLVSGESYRIRVYACNSAGLCSDTVSSDGFLYLSTGNESPLAEQQLWIIPDEGISSISIDVAQAGELVVYSSSGQRVIQKAVPKGTSTINCAALPAGTYHFSLGNQLVRYTKV
jgi:hypothetical protein